MEYNYCFTDINTTNNKYSLTLPFLTQYNTINASANALLLANIVNNFEPDLL